MDGPNANGRALLATAPALESKSDNNSKDRVAENQRIDTPYTADQASDTGSNRLPTLVGEILAEHAAARKAGEEFVRHAIKAGQRLLEAKELIPHGSFADWLIANIGGLSIRTAQKYMKAARLAGKNEPASLLSLRHVLKQGNPTARAAESIPLAHIPPSGHISVGIKETAKGWDEIWIVPWSDDSSYLFVAHIWTEKTGGDTYTAGTIRPVRLDAVGPVVAMLCPNQNGMTWLYWPHDAWGSNLVLAYGRPCTDEELARSRSGSSSSLAQRNTGTMFQSIINANGGGA